MDQENPTSKGKRSNEGNNTKKLKEKDESKNTESRDSKNPTLVHFSHGNNPEKEEAEAEEEILNQYKEE